MPSPESRPLILGYASSALLTGAYLLAGEITESKAGPEWPEQQLRSLGYEHVTVTKVITLFPDSLGCESSHAAGAKFNAIDPQLGHRAVSGAVCLSPGGELSTIIMDEGSDRAISSTDIYEGWPEKVVVLDPNK